MKILLAVDGSDPARRATQRAITLAGELRQAPELHLLTVHPAVPSGLVQRHISQASLDAYYREEGEAVLKPFREQLEAAGLTYTPHVLVGIPAEAIAHEASRLNCDLICMGTRGMGRVGDAILGSVARATTHHASVPVLLIK